MDMERALLSVETQSIFGHRRIDVIRPGQDAPFQIAQFSKTRLAQQLNCLGTSSSRSAMDNNVTGAIQLVNPVEQLIQRNEMRSINWQISNSTGLRTSQNEEILSLIQFLLELLGRNFHNPGRCLLFLTNATKLLVVDEFLDAGILSADRALWVLAQLQLAELHSQASKRSRRPTRDSPLPSIN